MTREELLRKFPRASEAFLSYNADDSGLRSDFPKPTAGQTLDRKAPGDPSGAGWPAGRYRLRFRVFALRPLDADNAYLKPMQDMLVKAGILPGDAWNQLEISVVSEKVKHRHEERTEIEIEKIG